METIGNLWLYVVFFGLVTVMLLVDFLGFKQKSRCSNQASRLLEYCLGHCSNAIWWGLVALSTANSRAHPCESKNHGILRRLSTGKITGD